MKKKYISIIIFFFLFYITNINGQTKPNTDPKNKQEIDDKFLLNRSIKMYPNPVGEVLVVESNIPIIEIQIYSLLGHLIKRINSNFENIRLGDLNTGVYMIKIYSNNNSVTKKLIKK